MPKPSLAVPDPDLTSRLDLNPASSQWTCLHSLTVSHPGFPHGALFTSLGHRGTVPFLREATTRPVLPSPLPSLPPWGSWPVLLPDSMWESLQDFQALCLVNVFEIHSIVTDDRGKRCRWVGNSVIQTFRNKAEISFLSLDSYFKPKQRFSWRLQEDAWLKQFDQGEILSNN